MGLTSRLPNIILTNENNEKRNFHDLIENKTVIINMFYSRCEERCIPLGRLINTINLLLTPYIEKDNIHFISISIDPTNDTVEDINAFKNSVCPKDTGENNYPKDTGENNYPKDTGGNNCPKGWHFYTTTNKNDIEKLRYTLGMYSPEPEIDNDISNHSGHFTLFNEFTGFIKHTEAFDNPVDIARKVVQLVTNNFYTHDYSQYMKMLHYDKVPERDLFENIHSLNQTFTLPYLPQYLIDQFEKYAGEQRGFQYDPLKKDVPKKCCCKS